VESGPGLLVTGAIGGVVGAVAGDKVADWLNDRRINQQTDRDGHTWSFEPRQPDRGWTRTDRTIDADAMRYSTREAPIYQTRTLTADPPLSDRLTWQASNTSIELALGSLPRSRDPYSLPANAQDTPSMLARNWTPNPQTGQWQREVVDQILEHGMASTYVETANPNRAAQLNAQAQAILVNNAWQTPAAMAEQYRAAHLANGWSQYGPLPEAVQDALRHPDRIVGSDGYQYERGHDRQWHHDGLLWDSRAQGAIQRELDATHQTYQAMYAPARTQGAELIPTLETVQVYAPRTAHADAHEPPAIAQTPMQRYEAAVAATQGRQLDPFDKLYLACLHPDDNVCRTLSREATNDYMNSPDGQRFQQDVERQRQLVEARERQAELEAELARMQQVHEETQRQTQHHSRGLSR
jgi:hypothetical protein